MEPAPSEVGMRGPKSDQCAANLYNRIPYCKLDSIVDNARISLIWLVLTRLAPTSEGASSITNQYFLVL